MSERKFFVIGISDSHNQEFSSEVLDIIKKGKSFSGGKRHYELIRDFLPDKSVWIDIVVPLDQALREYEKWKEIIVFASGDPLFYGFAATLKREFPDDEIVVYPSFNALQMLSHKLLLPYGEMINISLTGRSWENLDISLLENREMIGVLTDKNKTPSSIARYLLEYGYDNYKMFIGQQLGNDEEKVREMELDEAAKTDFKAPNCLILKMKQHRKRFFGIPEKEFNLLDGRANMITKRAVRMVSLSLLDLFDKKVLWDIGFCTGSVSIEAKLNFPKLNVVAFEKREEALDLLKRNSRKFGVPGIKGLTGNFLDMDLKEFPRPDAVFIGGHGGKLNDIIKRLMKYMNPGGVIVFNSVTKESYNLFKNSVESNGLAVVETHSITIDQHNPITVLKAE